jgi:hypothetical protein
VDGIGSEDGVENGDEGGIGGECGGGGWDRGCGAEGEFGGG